MACKQQWFSWYLMIVLSLLINNTGGTCTWPADFANSVWTDSLNGDLVFGSSTMSGWPFTVSVTANGAPQTLSSWECIQYDETGNYLVMGTTDTVELFVTRLYTGYRCLKLSKVTDVSYRYYQIEPHQIRVLNNLRVLIADQESGVPSLSFACNEALGASGSEFQVMLKSANRESAKIRCPHSFLANFSFTYTSTDGSFTCDAVTDVGQMDMCTNRTELTSQTPACSPSPFYSDNATVWCVDAVPVGDNTFVMLYNGQQDAASIDGITTHTFSCVGMNSNGTRMSVTPNHCKANQLPEEVPKDSLNNPSGATVTLSMIGDPCPFCPVLSDPLKGQVSIATSGAVTMATYVCDTGYTLSGSATRTCQDNGTWSEVTPSCSCPLLSAPTNGNVAFTNNGLTAQYLCDVGAVLVGSTTRTCDTTTNLWSGTATTCDSCQPLTSPPNGSHVVSSDGVTSVVTYSCDVGTTLNGDTSRTCQTNTQWSSAPPTCISCPSLSNPLKGTVTVATTGEVTTAMYQCDTNYNLVGSTTRTCQVSGTWNGTEPSCTCPVLSAPTNGNVTFTNNDLTAQYLCDVGAVLVGSTTRTCDTTTNLWNGTDTMCDSCQPLTSPPNGSHVISSDGVTSVVTYSCDVGTTLNGDTSRTCQTNTQWSSAPPTCTSCPMLSNPLKGTVTTTTSAVVTTATYQCDTNNNLVGAAMRICQVDGAWNGTEPSCTCPPLETPTNGNISLSDDGLSVLYQCQEGAVLVGVAARSCDTVTNTWNGTDTTCEQTTSTTTSTTALPGSSSGGSGDQNSLLSVVIVLAVVAGLFAGACFALLFYVVKLKKSMLANISMVAAANDTDKKYDDISKLPSSSDLTDFTVSGIVIPSKSAPISHQQHIMSIQNMTASRPPIWSESVTPRSMRSPSSRASTASVRTTPVSASGIPPLDLVRDSTSSSIITGHPAPWRIPRVPSRGNIIHPDSQAGDHTDQDKQPGRDETSKKNGHIQNTSTAEIVKGETRTQPKKKKGVKRSRHGKAHTS